MESEVTEQVIDVPLVMPFEGRPFVLDPEPLTRGAIATKTDNGYLVNWRRLIDDPRGTTFRVYRNGTLISDNNFTNTNLLDKAGTATALYEVETWSQGVLASKDTALMLDKSYWDIPLDLPAGGTTPSGNYVYVPGDCMVADVDGDQ